MCSEMWPGNTADVTTLIPVIDRLGRRFDIARVCVVADRGMISAETMAELEVRRLLYILGVRERTDKLVRDLVLEDRAPFVPLTMKKRGKEADYEAKTVMLAAPLHCLPQPSKGTEGCRRSSFDRGRAGAPTRQGRQSVGRQYRLSPLSEDDQRRSLRDRSRQDQGRRKIRRDLVLRTNTDLNPLETMLCYKHLSTVEQTSAPPSTSWPLDRSSTNSMRHPRPRVLQLSRTGAEESAGGSHAAFGRSGSWPQIIADLNC